MEHKSRANNMVVTMMIAMNARLCACVSYFRIEQIQFHKVALVAFVRHNCQLHTYMHPVEYEYLCAVLLLFCAVDTVT